MTKEAAIFQFWGQFLPAYEENIVPSGEDAPKFPYITYQVVTDNFDSEVPMTASVWDESMSWSNINKIVNTISETIGDGLFIKCDGGKIWIKKGTPFAQNMGDDSNDMIRRKYINITAEFLTLN
jgi:hypothetical protein